MLIKSFSFAEGHKIVTVDMEKLYVSYYKTKEAEEKIKTSFDKAREQNELLVKEHQELLEKFNEINEKANNPLRSSEAREDATEEAKAAFKVLREKEQAVKEFQVTTQQSLMQRQKNHRDLMLEEIKEVVLKHSRKRNAAIVLDTNGKTHIGISNVIYTDPEWDITESVITDLNKNAPATKE